MLKQIMNFLQDQLKDENKSKYIHDGLYLVGILGMLYYGATEYILNLLFLSFLSYKTLLTLLSFDSLYKKDIISSSVFDQEYLLQRWTVYGFYYFSSLCLDSLLIFPMIGPIYYYCKLGVIVWTLQNNQNMEKIFKIISRFIMDRKIVFDFIEAILYVLVNSIKHKITAYTGISFKDPPMKKLA